MKLWCAVSCKDDVSSWSVNSGQVCRHGNKFVSRSRPTHNSGKVTVMFLLMIFHLRNAVSVELLWMPLLFAVLLSCCNTWCGCGRTDMWVMCTLQISSAGGRHNMPPPPASWPFELESGVRVTCDVGYLCANYSLPRPLCSQLRPNVCDRQTDVRRTSSLNASAPWGRGIITTNWNKTVSLL